MAECFKLFDIIHRCTTSHEVVSRISREVAEDFAADNVIYLELRTTPKVLFSVYNLLLLPIRSSKGRKVCPAAATAMFDT